MAPLRPLLPRLGFGAALLLASLTAHSMPLLAAVPVPSPKPAVPAVIASPVAEVPASERISEAPVDSPAEASAASPPAPKTAAEAKADIDAEVRTVVEAAPADVGDPGNTPVVMTADGRAPLPPSEAKPPPPLPDAQALIAKAGFPAVQVGYMVLDLGTGEVLAAHNGNRSFLPASVAKVPTTVVALDILGPSYRFETELATDGVVDKNGTLKGTLWLTGEGDPLLDADRMKTLIKDLARAGVKRLDGRFLYDDTFLRGGPEIDAAQPDDIAYNPGWGALSLDFNRVMLSWDRKGPRFVEMYGSPPVDRVSVRRTGTGDGPWSEGGRFFRYEAEAPTVKAASLEPVGGKVALPKATWVLSPTLPPDGSRWLPVKEPGAQAAAVFRALAARGGIELPAPRPGPMPTDARPLARAFSEPLYEVARRTLLHSNNLAAELIGLTATRRVTGQPLSMTDSGTFMGQVFSGAMPDVDWTGFVLANHSGLSSDSRTTPAQMAAILRYAQRFSFSGLDYAELLPRRAWADKDGRKPAKVEDYPQVWAKTGTMYYGRGLAGYLVSRSGRPAVFAVFTSDLDKRATFDEKDANASPRAVAAAKGWLHRARTLEKDLVSLWLQAF